MLALWLAASSAAADLPPPPSFNLVQVPMTRLIQELCFPSGLRVTVIQDDRAPVVGVTAVVGRGFADDPPATAGAAHLLEHLWYRSRPGGGASIFDRFRAEGALYNAYTMTDATVFLAVASRDRLGPVLRLYGSLVTDPLAGIGPAELRSEQDIVGSEDRGTQLDARDALNLLPDGFFPEGHAYRNLAPITWDTVHAVTLDQVRANASTAYRPDLVSLQIVGSASRDEIRAQIEATFPEAALWNGPDGKPAPESTCDARPLTGSADAPPTKPAVPIAQVEANVEQPLLVVAWRLPAAYAAQGNVLGVATAHLAYRVRAAFENRPDRLQPSCGTFDGLRASVAMCIVGLEDGEPALKWKDRIAGALAHTSVTDELAIRLALPYFQRSAQTLVMDSLETVAGIYDEQALAYALDNHFTHEPDYYRRAVEGVWDISFSAVESFEDEWLTRDAAWAIHVLPRGSRPVDEGTATDLEPVEPAPTRAAEVSMAPTSAHGEYLRNSTDLDALASIESRDPDTVALPTRDATVLHLNNGLTAVIVPYGSVPVVRLALVFGGAGAVDEPAPGAQALRAWLAYPESGELENGHWLTASNIAGEWMEWPAARTRSTILRASSGNLDGALYLMRSYTQNTVIAGSKDVRRKVTKYLSTWIDDLASQPDVWEPSLRLVPVLGDQSFAWSDLEQAWAGTTETTRDQLQDWERATARPATSTLYVVGRIDPTRAAQLIHQYFDSWQPEGTDWVTPPHPTLPALPQRAVLVLDDPHEDEAVVSASCRADAGTRASREVAASTLDWYAWQALRLAPDLAAYNPDAWVETTDETSFAVFTIRVNVRADQAGRAVLSVLDVFRRASADDDPRVVSFVKGELRRQEQVNWLTTQEILTGLIETSGATGDLSAVAAHFEALGGADPRTALAGCVGHEVVTVRGPADAIEASLRPTDTAFSRTDVAAYVQAIRAHTVH